MTFVSQLVLIEEVVLDALIAAESLDLKLWHATFGSKSRDV